MTKTPIRTCPAGIAVAAAAEMTPANDWPKSIPRGLEADVERLVADDGWWMQGQLDGPRVLVRKRGDTVVAIGSAGRPVDLPPAAADAVAAIGADACLMAGVLTCGDGGGGGLAAFHADDLLERDGADLRACPYALRYDGAMDLVDAVPSDALRFVETACRTAAKRAMLARLLRGGRRGVVFRLRWAPHARGGSEVGFVFDDVAPPDVDDATARAARDPAVAATVVPADAPRGAPAGQG